MDNQVINPQPKYSFPTETIELPSKGLLYPKDNLLSLGTIDIKYMTAVHEDILTNQSYFEKGIVLDKLMKELIASPINYDDLLIGDKNAIMIAARVLGYGKNYDILYNGKPEVVDLTTLNNKPFDTDIITPYKNEFKYTLPNTGIDITFKILSHKDEKEIDAEIEGLKKIHPDSSPQISTRLKYIITSVKGNYDKKEIREFVDKHLLASDSRALREYIKKVQPDVDLTFFPEGSNKAVKFNIGLDFFWPDIK